MSLLFSNSFEWLEGRSIEVEYIFQKRARWCNDQNMIKIQMSLLFQQKNHKSKK